MKTWALIVLLAAAGGCASEQPVAVMPAPLHIQGHGSLTIEKIPIKIHSPTNDQTLELLVTYHGSFELDESFSNLDFAGDRILQQPERVGIYLANQVVRYLNTGKTDDSVTIECDDGAQALNAARANPAGWCFDTNTANYCKNTLAVRYGTNVIEILPERKGLPRDWAPLNWASWPTWYGQVDQELHLDDTFGQPAAKSTQ